MRIGELSRRSGVSPELLRAWEHRYRLLRPMRSEGGFRLYSPQDERRVAVMRSHLERGLSAAEAARLTLDEESVAAPHTETPALERSTVELRAALDAFDESAAQSALDRLLSGFSVDIVLREVVLTYLRELGDRWERGRGVRRSGAFRQPGPARAPARACAKLGPGRRPARPARMHAR